MESRVKTTYHLFKWCGWLKAVFVEVYWLRILSNLKNLLPGCSGQVYFHVRLVLIPLFRWKFAKYVCTYLMSKPIKMNFFSCYIPILIIRDAKLAVSASYAQSRDSTYAACKIHVFWTPRLRFFLGKACLDTWIRWLNPEFYNQIVKFWIQSSILLHTQPHIDL